MDPHYWHLQSIIIDHDHPYCRPSYLDPISTLCIEPTFKSHQLGLNEGASQGWIDVEGDETELYQSSEFLVTETTSRFADFCASNPIEEPKCDNNQTSSATSSHVTWNIIVDKLYRNTRKMLMQIDLESSIFSHMSKHKFDEFRYRSYQELLTKRVTRHIRKAFTSLNWRIDTSVELHESLLNTLPSNLLLPYLNGYAGLMHHSRVLHLLRRLNAEIISRHGVKRFDYAKYLDYASLPSKDFSGSSISRTTYGRLHDGSASSFSPITFIPMETLICGGLGTSASTPGRASSMMDEPTFMCLIAKGQTQGSRINKMLKNLSQLGRLMIIPMSGTANVQIRRLIRHFVSVSEDPRPIPIYLIGFGEHCDIVLTAAITSPYLLPSSNGGALEEIICGRLASTDAPVPTKPWLAGLVLIAPPKTAYRLDRLGGGLDNIARRCSLLLVISSKHQVEATAFRDALLTARRRSTAPSAHCGVTALRGADWKVPCEFDLRMLVIGGADHLLRMHPATLRRFATTQGAIDLAIVTAIKNLVAVSRTLVNTSAASVSTHGTGTLEVSGNRSAAGLPTSWLSNTNAQQTARKGVDGTPFTRKASILRGSVHARNFPECHPPSQTRSPKQDPSFHQRNRMAYSGSFRNPVSGYDDGSHVRTSYSRNLQQNSNVPVFFGTRAFRRETGESVMDASSHDSVPQAKTLRNHSAQSAPYGYGRVRTNRFYNRN